MKLPDKIKIVKKLFKKYKKHIIETMKFGVVGACAYVATVVPFNLLLHIKSMRNHSIIVTILATTCGVIVAWLGNRHWTWKKTKNDSAVKEAVIFFSTNAILSVLLPVFCVWVSVNVLGKTSILAHNIAVNVVGAAIGTILRFLVYKFIIYNPKVKI